MYSILKTQKRSLTHNKNITVTSSIFLTNNHILLTFSDRSISVYHLNLSQPQTKQKLYQSHTSSIVIQSKRIKQGLCAITCKNLTNIYILQLKQNTSQHTYFIQLKPMEKSTFACMLSTQNQNNVINIIGCQIKLYTFTNGCFIIQYYIHDDKKIILDCYKIQQQVTKNNNTYNKSQYNLQNIVNYTWQLSVLQIDIQINGNYILQPINYHTGQLALYKQTQINDIQWKLKIYSPFINNLQIENNPQNPQSNNKQAIIILPQDRFNDDTIIMQITEYIQQSYMVIVGSRANSKLSAYALFGLTQQTVGDVSQNMVSFKTIPQQKCTFLSDNFIKILYINNKDQILYALTHNHQIIGGEIYFNSLIIGNLRTGKLIQKGHCTLRNIDFSPNYRYILDVPYQFDKISHNQNLFHIRLLLSKSSLYMFLIQNNQGFKSFSQRFKNVMIQLL